MSRLEGAYEQVSERLGDLSRGQGTLRTEMNEGIAALRAEMNGRFNVLLVLLGTLWATTVGGFIALFTRI